MSEDHTPNHHRYLRAAGVKARYGDVSDMWLHRKLADPNANFPRPVYFASQRYWLIADLERWEEAQPQKPKRRSAVEVTA